MAVMLFDHIVVAFVPPPSIWFYALRVPGRFAMPAFALMSAQACSTPWAKRYLLRVVLLATVSEYPYWLLFGEHVNAVAALSAGVGAVLLRRSRYPVLVLPFMAAYAILAWHLHAGAEIAYAALVLALAEPGAWARRVAYGLTPFLNGIWLPYVAASAAALWWASHGPLPAAPRIPRWLRYAFYPTHILLLGWLMHQS